MRSKVRLKDIAESLGLSVATVSRALDNHAAISDKTRNAVLDKVKELGYEFNSTARINLSGNTINLAVLCPYDVFFETVINGMKTAIEEFGPDIISVDYKFIDVYNVVEQAKQLREIANDNTYDCIAIAPAHTAMLDPLINDLVDSGKKVITFNTDAPSSKRAFYIGQNALVASKMAAQLLGNQLRENEEIAVLSSFAPTSGLKERLEGFFRFKEENYQNIRTAGPFEYFDSIDAAKNIAEQVILLNKNVKALYSNNMVGTIGCARAVKDTGNTGKIIVVGFDDNEEIERFINEGIIYASILQEPFNQGYLTIKTLFKWMLEDVRPEAEFLYTKCDLLMKSNIELQKNNNPNILI